MREKLRVQREGLDASVDRYCTDSEMAKHLGITASCWLTLRTRLSVVRKTGLNFGPDGGGWRWSVLDVEEALAKSLPMENARLIATLAELTAAVDALPATTARGVRVRRALRRAKTLLKTVNPSEGKRS